MKKIITVLTIILVLMVGCSNETKDKKISDNQALELVMEDLDIDEDQMDNVRIVKQKADEGYVYEIEFVYDNQAYIYDLNQNGEIIKIEKEKVVDNSKTEETVSQTEDKNPETEESNSKPAENNVEEEVAKPVESTGGYSGNPLVLDRNNKKIYIYSYADLQSVVGSSVSADSLKNKDVWSRLKISGSYTGIVSNGIYNQKMESLLTKIKNDSSLKLKVIIIDNRGTTKAEFGIANPNEFR